MDAYPFVRKSKLVFAVRWEGNLKALPKPFRDHKKGSSLNGRLELRGDYTVLIRGNVTAGVKVGDWLLRDQEGRLEVMSEDRFRSEYEPMIEMQGGVA